MATQGTAVVNFGTGALDASVAITGQAGFTAGTNLVEAWALGTEVLGSVADESAWVEQMTVYVTKQITGTGFTAVAKPAKGLAFGSYNIGWVYN